MMSICLEPGLRRPGLLRRLAIALCCVSCISSQLVVDRAVAADLAKPVLPANLREVNIWTRALGTARLPSPWRVAPCDPNSKAPLLCVYDRQTLVGTIEMGTYLLGSRPDLRKKLSDAGMPAKANYADPRYRSRITTALRAWVEDYYAFFKTDRTSAYSNKITFTPQPPTQVAIGKLTGLRYGFKGIKENHNIYEQRIGYAAFDGATLYIITTAFDAMSETGKFKTLEDFQRFEPHLTKLVAGLQLPIAPPAARQK